MRPQTVPCRKYIHSKYLPAGRAQWWSEIVWETIARPFELFLEFMKEIAKRCTASVRGLASPLVLLKD